MAAEIAAPMSQAKKITMVSSGDGQVGASKLTGEVLDIMIRVPDLVKSLTGIDMAKVFFFFSFLFFSMFPVRCMYFQYNQFGYQMPSRK